MNGGGKGFGGGLNNQGNNNNPQDPNNNKDVQWAADMTEADSQIEKQKGLILALVGRPNNTDDDKAKKKIGEFVQVVELQQKSGMGLLSLNSETDLGKELVTRLSIKSFPVIVFLDQYGNPISAMNMPDSGTPIATAYNGDKSLQPSIDKYFSDHLSKGDALFAKGKLREAYAEYGWLAPLKGPDAEKGNAGQAKVLAVWTKLLDQALKAQEKSIERDSILAGLRQDTKDSSAQDRLEAAIKAGNAAALKDAPAEAPKPNGKLTSESTASSKVLADLINARINIDDIPETVNLSALTASNDQIKQAAQLFKEGQVFYGKAIDDKSDGMTRGQMYKFASEKFLQGLELLNTGLGDKKPDAGTARVRDQVLVLLYNCYKFASLTAA